MEYKSSCGTILAGSALPGQVVKEEKKMRYFELVDHINGGMIVRVEGREQYMYVYGESMWQRTGILLLYYSEDTVYYEKFKEITEEQAYEIIEQTNVQYRGLEKICIDKLKKINGLIPDVKTKDLEIKIIFLLYCISKIEKINVYELKNYGFTSRMLRTLQLLIENSNMESDLQMENVLYNTLAMLVKSEYILQNGPKSDKEKRIIEKKIRYDNLLGKLSE